MYLTKDSGDKIKDNLEAEEESKDLTVCPTDVCCSLPPTLGLPGGSEGNESACKERDLGSVPGSGRSPGGGHGHPLQCSCLENPMDKEPGRLQSTGREEWTRLTRHTAVCV